jgi:hypothetical protein
MVVSLIRVIAHGVKSVHYIKSFKMLFYTILIFQLSRTILCTVDLQYSPKENENVKNLVGVIMKLHVSNGKCINSKDNECDNLDSPYDIENLKNIFHIIFKQISNYYHKLLVEIETKKSDPTIDLNDKLFKSQYVETVCLYTIRVLDFIYMNTKTLSSVIPLYNLYFNLFHAFPIFITEKCQMNQSGKYTCDKENINLLLNSEGLIKEFDNVNTEDNCLKISQDLILGVYNIINDTDQENPKANSLIYKDIFIQQYPDYVDKLSCENQNGDYTELENNCNVIINKLIRENNEKQLTVPEKINYLLLLIYQKLKEHFQKGIFTYLKDNIYMSLINVNLLSTIVSNMFHRFCKPTPLILHYLSNRNINDKNLFTLYFTLCGDYIGFFIDRCAVKMTNIYEDITLNAECVMQSFIDKLSVNIEKITPSNIIFDMVQDNPTKDSMESIVENIYNAMKKSYKASFLWTNYDWLSAKYFFRNNHKSLAMNNLKERTVLFDGTPMNLLEIYTYLLPFDQNMRTVFFFHNMLILTVERILNTFVYRHAKLTIMYFNLSDKGSVNFVEYKNVIWYEDGSVMFYKNLFTRAVNHERQHLFDSIIEEIKIINEHNYTELTEKLSDIDEKYLLDWDKIDSLDLTHVADPVDSLKSMLKNNCEDATSFIINFISIVNQSNVTDKIIIDDNYTSNCIRIEESEVIKDKVCV